MRLQGYLILNFNQFDCLCYSCGCAAIVNLSDFSFYAFRDDYRY